MLGPLLARQSLWAGPNAGDPNPQRTSSSPVGTLPGTFEVDDNGAARFSIPLELPPAARGSEPSLSLTYDSQSGDGPLGVGWSLTGQSAITRCGHTLADDGEVAPVRMTAADALCLDGARLMLVEGNAFEIGSTYRRKRDDFTRIRVIAGEDDGSACHGGYGFEVRSRDGSIATYGCRRDATVTTHLGPRAWALARVRDRFGNFADYHYDYEQAAVTDSEGQWLGDADIEHALIGIDYGAHLQLHGPTRNVRLIWEPRSDPRHGWSLGAPLRQSKRLSRIDTFAQGASVHRYELDYDHPSITDRSLLTSVRQCDADGVCKPATTFEWEAGALGLALAPSDNNFSQRLDFPWMAWTTDPQVVDPGVRAQTVLDANGDGRTDMLLAVGNGGPNVAPGRGWELWTSQPGASGEQGIACGSQQPGFEQCAAQGKYVVHEDARTGLLASTTFEAGHFANPPLFATDYDGDARDDAYALGDRVITPGEPPSGLTFYIARSVPEGGVEQFEFDPKAGKIWWFSGADQTGDGLGDLLFCAGEAQLGVDAKPVAGTGVWMFAPNIPNEGFSSETVVDLGLPCSAFDKFLQLDHDGDGLASLLVIPVWDTDAKQWRKSANWPDYHALRLDPLDKWAASLEPTGLPPDLAQRWRPAIAWPNDGDLEDDFPRSLQGFGLDRILDVNADGLPDILRYELTAGDTAADLSTIQKALVVPNPPLEEWGGIKLWINTGAGFRDGGFLLESSQAGDGFFRRFLASAVLDYDGDGRLDLLTPVDDLDADTWDWTIWVSNGDGSFDEHPQVFEYPVLDMTLQARTLGAFDLDGDTMHDFALFSAGAWTLHERPSAVPDRLVRIENGLGAWIEVGYRSITDFDAPHDFYQVDLDDCAYPQRCERDPQIVVQWHRLDNGQDGRRFEHHYGTARSDREAGHGLGFSFHETVELDEQGRPIFRSRVGYSHSHDPLLRAVPYAGIPATILVDQRDPETGRHLVTRTSRMFDQFQTTALTYHPYVSQAVTRSYELDACADTFCEVGDLDEASLTSDDVQTVFEIDEYGSPTLWTSSIDTGSTLLEYRHEATYLHDESSWLLGLLTHERLSFVEQGDVRERDSFAVHDPDTGALLTHVLEPTEPELFLHTVHGFDAHGNLISRKATDIDGVQRAASISYDAHGVFPATSINALGQVSSMRWDPGLGVAIEATDPNGRKIVADHDGLGHLTGVRVFSGNTPRGDETTRSYETLGPNFAGAVLQIRSKTNGHGESVVQYDRLGREILSRSTGIDHVVRDVITRHDRLGRIARTSLPTPYGLLPDFEIYEYDFADRPTRHQLADGTAETWAYDGLQTLHIDIGGSMSVLRHDLADRLIESTRALGTPDEERMCFDYGAFELLIRARPDCILRPLTVLEVGEAPPTIKTFEYDDLGQLIASHDPSEGFREQSFNGHGELEVAIDANGNEVVLERDALGRVITRSDADGLTSWNWDTDFIGELSATTSPDGHHELFKYDEFGRLEALTKIIAGEPFDLGFAYDEFGRLAQIHYPDSEALSQFSIRNVYADNGDLREVRSGLDDSLLWEIEDLDERGRISSEHFGNDAVTTRTHDPLRGFTRTIATASELDATLQSLEYEWNHDGTLARRDDHLHGQHETFEYDALHRVTAAHTSSAASVHARHFAYDSLGNLVFATDRGEYEYDEHGRLSVADGSTHTWDANGNLLARTGARAATFDYTAFDKPAVIDEGGLLTDLEYDASQARVYRYSEADARETVYVTDLYQRHHDDLAGETAHHYYIPGAERIVANVVDTVDALSATRATYYVHDDHLGSTDVVSDGAGQAVQRMSFDVWGKRRDPENWTAPDDFVQLGVVNLGYTGHEAQEDAGLLHMGGRMYDPHLGRMAGADPLIVDPTSTQGWNRYAYVLNSPLTLTDPSGFEPTPLPAQTAPKKPKSETKGAPRGDSGLIGGGKATQGPPKGTMQPGGSMDLKQTPEAEQQAGENGPGAGGGVGGNSANPSSPGELQQIDLGEEMRQVLDKIFVPDPHSLDAFAESMLPSENSSQERRRLDTSNQVKERVVHAMQNPPAHAMISLELTMFFIGGDLSGVGQAIKGGRQVLMRQGGKDAWPLVAGVVKKEGRKSGASGGKRAGKPHTQAAKRKSREQSDGTCPDCGIELTQPTRRVRGSNVSPSEAQGDHVYPRSQGGDGATVEDMRNIETICATCNNRKGARIK